MSIIDDRQGADGWADMPPSLREFIVALRSQPGLHVDTAARLLAAGSIQTGDLEFWQRLDHAAVDSYGIAPIHEEAGFTLQLSSWRPGDMSAIHGWGSSAWQLTQFLGEAEYATFEDQGGLLTTQGRRHCSAGEIVILPPGGIQQIGNTADASFLCLQLLGRQEGEGNACMELQLYDLDEGKLLHPAGMAAFFLPAQLQEGGSERRIQGDFPTWLRHNTELLLRLDHMQPLGGRPGLAAREARLLTEFNTADTWRALRQEMRLRLPRLDAGQQEAYIRSLSRELVSATRLFIQLHSGGRFDPRQEVLELIGEIIAMLEHDDFIARIAGSED